jgi:predicted transcriptional regulator
MKRSRDNIISEILDICTKGANKTQIVYKANLNFRTVNPYIDLLIKNKLITVKRRRRTPLQAGGACEAPPQVSRNQSA